MNINCMDYIIYTKNLICEGLINIVICPGFNIQYDDQKTKIITNIYDESDLVDWIINYRKCEEYQLVDNFIMVRVFEHLPIRIVDWYLYNIYTAMKSGGTLVITVPDMNKSLELLNKSYKEKNHFSIMRNTFEIYNEGDSVRDIHKIWTTEESLKYHLELEGHFEVLNFNRVQLDNPYIAPQIECLAKRV